MFGIKEKSAKVDAFVDKLVEELVNRFPADKAAQLGSNKLKPARQLGRTANMLEASVIGFQREMKLGIYGKAKLLNRLKWALKERGYSEAFIDQTVAELTRMLNVRTK